MGKLAVSTSYSVSLTVVINLLNRYEMIRIAAAAGCRSSVRPIVTTRLLINKIRDETKLIVVINLLNSFIF